MNDSANDFELVKKPREIPGAKIPFVNKKKLVLFVFAFAKYKELCYIAGGFVQPCPSYRNKVLHSTSSVRSKFVKLFTYSN